MSRFNWWPIVVIALALAADLVIIGNVVSPVRVAVVFAFLLIGPGMAFVQLLRIRQFGIELTLAIALSLTLDTLVAEALALTQAWSVGLALAVLLLLTLVGAVSQLIQSGLAVRTVEV